MTYLRPIEIPSYGYISANLAKAVTIPEAPWQKCTSLIFFELLLVLKFPLIKCLNRNIIDALIRLTSNIVSGPKSFCFKAINNMLILPPKP